MISWFMCEFCDSGMDSNDAILGANLLFVDAIFVIFNAIFGAIFTIFGAIFDAIFVIFNAIFDAIFVIFDAIFDANQPF